MQMEQPIKKIESIAGIALISLLVVGCFVILRPFISAMLWAGILCFSTWPLLIRLEKLFRGRRQIAALAMTLIVTFVLVVPFVIVGTKMAENISQAYDSIKELTKDGLPPPPSWLQNLPLVGTDISTTWQNLSDNPEKTVTLIKDSFTKSQGWLMRSSMALGHGIMQLTLSVFVSFFFYCNGETLVASFVGWGKLLVGDSTKHIFKVIGDTIRSVVYGLLGTAIAQGILAAIGYKIAGIPSAFLLGFVTFFLALVPVGPPLIWIPATLWLFHVGKLGWAIFMGVWGLVAISGVDNVLRPYLISRGSNLPFILILMGVVGGMFAFGFIGLFLGPSLLAVGYSLLQEWTSREKKEKA